MRVHADRDSCVSSGQCVLAAPEVFDQDDDEGVVLVKADRPPPGLAPDVRRAAMMCPARAITVTEDED
ncbi:MAG TPA: ferredoxin [Trebonia sp.]|jgi:ferredoxin|nr:ferredoxin [Trebonia sp.]